MRRLLCFVLIFAWMNSFGSAHAEWSYRGRGIQNSGIPLMDGSGLEKHQHNISLVTFQSSRSVESKKFRQSVVRKLKMVKTCYDNVVFREAWKAQKQSKTFPPGEQVKNTKTAEKHKLQVVLKLNQFGRAISTKVKSKTLKLTLKRCFSWYLQGRKYFPMEGKRGGTVVMSLLIKSVDDEKGSLFGSPKRRPKPRKRRRRRRRRR